MRKPVVLLAAVMLVLAACGDAGDPATAPTTGPAATAADGGPSAEYCAAFTEMAALQPAGSATEAELAASMNAFADAIEGFAALSPPDEAATLEEFAEVMRDTGADPTDPGLAERVSAVAGPVAAINLRAAADCGVEIDTG